ncbi:hypothetical protein CGMCC3_g4736 [Colletotrichum fructicola]|nr:uncharacterized protein CGMCC3_g4736 [Colletotrichum fructicola]KAE9579141.1 hypothetical protein CGMCC3_g4736 [Colletotrichum fructicola]
MVRKQFAHSQRSPLIQIDVGQNSNTNKGICS